MKKYKRLAAILTVLALLTVSVVVFAASVKSPGEILSGLTGQSQEALAEKKAEGETYGTMAANAGVLEQFRAGMLERRMAFIDQKVEEGKLTPEDAEQFKAAIQERQENCDGTGDNERLNIGQKLTKGIMARRGGGQGRR